MKRNIFTLLFFCLLGLPLIALAQTRNENGYIVITFTPNHSDWNYQLGENVEMDVCVRHFNTNLPNTKITYSWGMEMSKADITKTISTDQNGLLHLRLTGSKVPGFKTLMATTTFEGKEYTNYITVGFAPDQIQPTTTLPSDFMDFWQGCLSKARRIPLEPLYTLQPDLCTSVSDVYMVRYQVNREGSFFYGMLRVPKGVDLYHPTATRYPALLNVPGAGVRPYHGGSDSFAKDGIITLQVGRHGIPVNLPEELYSSLKNGALSAYNSYRSDDRDTYYYNRVYIGCVRAVDLLCTLPCVDTTHIGVYGSSQGGALTLVVAGLSDKITCAAPTHPALCELTGSQHGRIDGWPRMFTDGRNETSRAKKMEVSAYYDAVNFARFITVPVFFIQGYNDKACPPTSTLAAYNIITSSKQLVTPLDCAHWFYPENGNQRNKWLTEQLTH